MRDLLDWPKEVFLFFDPSIPSLASGICSGTNSHGWLLGDKHHLSWDLQKAYTALCPCITAMPQFAYYKAAWSAWLPGAPGCLKRLSTLLEHCMALTTLVSLPHGSTTIAWSGSAAANQQLVHVEMEVTCLKVGEPILQNAHLHSVCAD